MIIIEEHYAQGDGPTVQEIRAMERAERMKTEPENVVILGKWGTQALEMMEDSNNELYTKLKQEMKLVPFLLDLNETCLQQYRKMKEKMWPKATGDFLTDWQNREAMVRTIDEILLNDIIIPQVMQVKELDY